MTIKRTLSRKQRFFNNIDLTTDDEVYVGIDVHKTNCHIAIRLNGGLALTFVSPSDNIDIARMMGKPKVSGTIKALIPCPRQYFSRPFMVNKKLCPQLLSASCSLLATHCSLLASGF